ncbi:hypothetical protein [Paragemmobacter straminiformis]|uniref:HdeA/HdeB family protein n=1 Tax=Paragemmobacter straminiformis TaxID=2045119 RepID=A0A842ICV1_9RHOB|nr:hypothetical protein [Gemmobacter straminiformis]MBC2837640.1 hypothetical protein [Gemmobacter straminiformis]
MKSLTLLLGAALTSMTLATGAMAEMAVDPATLSCADFLAMDSTGMMAASDAVSMASDAMAGDAMAGDAMTDDAMAGDAMAGDAMAGDAMAGDMTAQITEACKAHPDAKVTDALAM